MLVLVKNRLTFGDEKKILWEDTMGKKILICGGGTAGHIYPAVSIIEHIKKKYPDCRLLFVGTKKGMESKFIPDLGIGFKVIKASGLSISGNPFRKILNYLKFLLFLIPSFLKSIGIIINFKPDIILGMGGYVCGPVILAGILLRKRFALHEQNYIPGRLNSFFSPFAEYVFTSFKETGKFFKAGNKKIIFTGNPVREKIKKLYDREPNYSRWGFEEQRFTIVAFGGSLGAEKINNIVINLYDYFRNNEKMQILLICGRRFYDKLINKISYNVRSSDKLIFKIFPYVNEMEEIYRIADIIISRAGANTVAEIAATNVPAILVPYPQAIGDHQFYNAAFLERNKKAIVILDSELTENIMIKKIEELLKNNRKKHREMKKKEINFQKNDSAKIITDLLIGSPS